MNRVYTFLVVIILSSLSFTSFSQTSRDWHYDANAKLFKKLFSQYDTAIAYSSDCDFSPSEELRVLVLDQNQWQLLDLKVSIQKPFTKKAHYIIESEPKKRFDVDVEPVKVFNDFLIANQFWRINYDSLNKQSDRNVWRPITGGCSERITYVTRTHFFSLYASNTDRYQKSFYTTDRERFIKCRNLFFELFSK